MPRNRLSPEGAALWYSPLITPIRANAMLGRKRPQSSVAATKTRTTTDYTDNTDESRSDQINRSHIRAIGVIRGKRSGTGGPGPGSRDEIGETSYPIGTI